MNIIYTDCRACDGSGKEIDHIKTGLRLRKLREKSGVSIREVARRLGIDNKYLSDMELGRRNWTEEKVERFLEAIK